MAKKVRAAAKGKKKSWVQIIAPKTFNEQVLGEIPVYEPSSVIGRHITVNLMTLTRDMRKQNTNIQFELIELKGAKAHTKTIGLRIAPASVKRFMRRNKNKIEESFVVETKDNLYVRIKPLLITASATHRSVLSTLRAKAMEIVAFECKKLNYETLVSEVISNKLQRTLRDRLKKIYPLKISEIRDMKLVSADKAKYVKIIAAKPMKEEPPKKAAEEPSEETEANPEAGKEEAKE